MRRFFGRAACLAFLCSLVVYPPASAGTLKTSHFLIIYPPLDESLAKTIAETLEKAQQTLTEALGVSHGEPLRIKLVVRLTRNGYARYLPDRRTIEVLNTESMTNNFGGKPPPLRFVQGLLWHEYTHFLQHRLMKRFIKDRTALWFIEGTAEYLGTFRFNKPYSPEAVWEEGRAVLSEKRLPTLEDLNRYHVTNQYPLTTYFFSADAVASLVDKWGMDALHCLTQGMGEGRGLEQSMRESLGIDIKTFEGQWHQELEQRYASYIRKS